MYKNCLLSLFLFFFLSGEVRANRTGDAYDVHELYQDFLNPCISRDQLNLRFQADPRRLESKQWRQGPAAGTFENYIFNLALTNMMRTVMLMQEEFEVLIKDINLVKVQKLGLVFEKNFEVFSKFKDIYRECYNYLSFVFEQYKLYYASFLLSEFENSANKDLHVETFATYCRRNNVGLELILEKKGRVKTRPDAEFICFVAFLLEDKTKNVNLKAFISTPADHNQMSLPEKFILRKILRKKINDIRGLYIINGQLLDCYAKLLSLNLFGYTADLQEFSQDIEYYKKNTPDFKFMTQIEKMLDLVYKKCGPTMHPLGYLQLASCYRELWNYHPPRVDLLTQAIHLFDQYKAISSVDLYAKTAHSLTCGCEECQIDISVFDYARDHIHQGEEINDKGLMHQGMEMFEERVKYLAGKARFVDFFNAGSACFVYFQKTKDREVLGRSCGYLELARAKKTGEEHSEEFEELYQKVNASSNSIAESSQQ